MSGNDKYKSMISTAMTVVVLLLSVALIVYISIDTFEDINFIENRSYMRFQLWVCIIFITDYFVELYLSDNKYRFLRRHWIFLILSIPYLSLIKILGLNISTETLFFIRFIPLARGFMALSIVIGWMTENKITSLILSYVTIMLAIIYFASLIFLDREQPVNNMVPDFGAALWWAFMNATTIGSDINPITVEGKILSVLLAILGMVMFPLFTVYIASWVHRYNAIHSWWPNMALTNGKPKKPEPATDTDSQT